MLCLKNVSASLILCLLVCLISVPLKAEIQHRGFNTHINAPIEGILPEIRDSWGINLLRIGLGNFEEQDDINSMAQYMEMMNPLFDRLDQLLPIICEAGIRVVPALMSPPGGLAPKGEGTSQLRIFSEAWAQQGLKELWDDLSERYAGNEECIYAYDILNEPAQAYVEEGLLSWRDLSLELVDIIRANDPDTKIIVKSVYGNPQHLRGARGLPDFVQPGVIVGVHIYPNIAYVHQGLEGTPIDMDPPGNRPIVRRSLLPIALYLLRQENRHRRGLIPYVPELNIGEFAVARWAPGAESYLDRLLGLIEGDIRRRRFFNRNWLPARARPARIRRVRRTLNQMDFSSWTYHAFEEARVWDPRYSDDPQDDTFISPPNFTPRGAVLKSYFQRNLE